ncbi:probable 28S ribosomal protein S26, mitochondrial [Ischnura elegans]|uniref:probable 28S ribosomal protein S26, mitochondrial n=1 Tax=Ischnura elegans TaxID=197161 RepID=UPI001ED881C6|nr:probable 28S ribosomal protein S26, mitochondrial [Ischnura elegans]XP_046385779.1 probable 28S ribosomal protein S26, mitochondrial [Ischnura elegans]
MLSHIKYGILSSFHSVHHGEIPSVTALSQFVRWKRKAIWAPIAKSKLFRIPERKPLPEDETLELRRLYNIYRTQVKSIRSYLENEYKMSTKELPEQNLAVEDEEIAHALKVNELWNKEVKAIREKRLAKEAEEEREQILERMIIADKEAEEQLLLIESIVKQEKGKASSFITPEKLDEAIEYALANPVDYNYSIDLDGNTVYGLKAKPEVVEKAVDHPMSAAN